MKLNFLILSVRLTINIIDIFLSLIIGEDISEGKDQTIIRRIFKKGEGWAKPNDGSNVDVSLKGTYENRVFDDRKLKFIVGEGSLKDIPEGFVNFLHLIKSVFIFCFFNFLVLIML